MLYMAFGVLCHKLNSAESHYSWTQLPLGRPLARLSCALYGDHFYMISNNANSVFRYDPTTATLNEWLELQEANVEFAGQFKH